MIILSEENLLETNAEYIVNAANRIGWMGGIIAKYFKSNGVAETLQYASKGKIEKEAMKYSLTHRVKLGDVYITNSYHLPYQGVIHVVTVLFPGFLSTEKIVEKGLINLVKTCEEKGIKSVVLTGLGTGTGKVSINKVSQLYVKYLEPSSTTFIVVDKNKEFINNINRVLKNPI